MTDARTQALRVRALRHEVMRRTGALLDDFEATQILAEVDRIAPAKLPDSHPTIELPNRRSGDKTELSKFLAEHSEVM